MKRVLIFGNSGAGKSTMAKRLSGAHSIPHLDLDTLAWEPAQPGVRLPFADSKRLLEDFIAANPAWIIEGCYASLIEIAARFCTELRFLNPGIERCIENNKARLWEPHKYSSADAQNKNLEMLQDWVHEYELRNDEFSLAKHREIFDKFLGVKKEYKS